MSSAIDENYPHWNKRPERINQKRRLEFPSRTIERELEIWLKDKLTKMEKKMKKGKNLCKDIGASPQQHTKNRLKNYVKALPAKKANKVCDDLGIKNFKGETTKERAERVRNKTKKEISKSLRKNIRCCKDVKRKRY